MGNLGGEGRLVRYLFWEDFRGAGMWWEVLGIAQMVLAWDQGVTCCRRTLERMSSLTALLGSLRRVSPAWCVRRVGFIRSTCDWGSDGSGGLSPLQIHCLNSSACPGVTKAFLLLEHEPCLKSNLSLFGGKDVCAVTVLRCIKAVKYSPVVFAKFSCLIASSLPICFGHQIALSHTSVFSF